MVLKLIVISGILTFMVLGAIVILANDIAVGLCQAV